MKKLLLSLFAAGVLFSCSNDEVSPASLAGSESPIVGAWKGDLNCNQVDCDNKGEFWQFEVSEVSGDSLNFGSFTYDSGDPCKGVPDCSFEGDQHKKGEVKSSLKGDSVIIAFNIGDSEGYRNTIFKGVFLDTENGSGRLEGKIIVDWGGEGSHLDESGQAFYGYKEYSFLYSDKVVFSKQ